MILNIYRPRGLTAVVLQQPPQGKAVSSPYIISYLLVIKIGLVVPEIIWNKNTKKMLF